MWTCEHHVHRYQYTGSYRSYVLGQSQCEKNATISSISRDHRAIYKQPPQTINLESTQDDQSWNQIKIWKYIKVIARTGKSLSSYIDNWDLY